MNNDFLDIISYSNIIVSIDLHSFQYTHDALEFLHSELYHVYTEGEQYIRIIHGIGNSILQKKVHAELVQNSLIKDFILENHGGSTIATYYPQ